MTPRIIVLELAQLEAAHLTDLVVQFVDLLDGTAVHEEPADPALARLVPDAYADDDDAAADFRELTQGDLLARRRADAASVLATLQFDGRPLSVSELGETAATTAMTVHLDPDQIAAWLRTLTALRLVLASRLGVQHEADHDPEDPRFGVYNWLGFRLEGLLHALES